MSAVTPVVLERFVRSAPDPRPGMGRHRGLSVKVLDAGSGGAPQPLGPHGQVPGRLPEVRLEGLTLAIIVVLILSSSNALIQGLTSRSRRATSSSSAPQ